MGKSSILNSINIKQKKKKESIVSFEIRARTGSKKNKTLVSLELRKKGD